MIYPEPVAAAIEAEVQRLLPRYEAFMKAQDKTPDKEELRAWAIENLREQIILEEEAKAAGKSLDAFMKSIVEAVPAPTVEEARAYYKAHPERFVAPERVHARHIVIHRTEATAAEATTRLLNVRELLKLQSLAWADAVKQFSSCPNGDDLGVFPRGAMVPTFEEAAFQLEEGAISDVVETEFGWHLIKCEAHLPEEQLLFDEVKQDLLAFMQTERERTALEAFVDARKTTA